MIVDVHVASAALAAVVVVAVALTVIVGVATGRPLRFAIDRLILAVLAVVAFAVVSGVALIVSGRSPRDGLHLLYAAVALVTLPVARFVWPALTPGRRAVGLLIGCAVMAGLLVRLAQTG